MLLRQVSYGVTVSVAVFETPPPVAVMVTDAVLVTCAVFIVNDAELDPAGTTTLAGTEAVVEPLFSVITVPPVGATPVNVTVPVEGVPPVTDVGLRPRLVTAGDSTVRLPVFVTP